VITSEEIKQKFDFKEHSCSDNMLRLTYEYTPYGTYHSSMKEDRFPRESIENCYGQKDKCSGEDENVFFFSRHILI
jgi:hypothetical protein